MKYILKEIINSSVIIIKINTNVISGVGCSPMKKYPEAWSIINRIATKIIDFLFFSLFKKDKKKSIITIRTKMKDIPSIRTFKLISRFGRFGIRSGSLKYLKVESNITLLTEAFNPLIRYKTKPKEME